MLTLDVTKRSKADHVGHMRNNGMVPGVVYGAKVENTSVSFHRNMFEKVWKEAGESSTVDLVLEGKVIQVLIQEVQTDPVKNFVTHVDFLAVDANTKAHVHIPIEFIGIAPAQKAGIGNVVKVLHEIEIKALPKDIPHQIEVDISVLDTIDSQISAGDIKLPAGVDLITGEDDIIVAISAMKDEVDSAPVDLASIEVAKKGKKEVSE
jgi:large subunit ribosomal protein L25